MSLPFLLAALPVRFVPAAYANTVPSLLTPAQVCELLSIGDATLRRYAKNNPHFPRKVKLGPRRVAYVSAEIEKYIETMKEPMPNREATINPSA